MKNHSTGVPPGPGQSGMADSHKARRLSAAFPIVLTWLVSFLWFLSRMSPGIAFGIWQGPFMAASPLRPLPLLSQGLFYCARSLPGGEVAWRLNLLTCVLAAFSCAFLTAISQILLKTTARESGLPSFPIERSCCAALCGILFALTPCATRMGTAASPASLTLLLALASVLLLLHAWLQPSGTSLFVASGMLAGLACTNHPSFGILATVVLLGAALGRPRGRTLPDVPIVPTALAIASGAVLPLVAGGIRGESVREFLSHAMGTPYFAPGGAGVSLDSSWFGARELPLGLLALVPLSFLLFSGAKSRLHIGLLLVLPACFGPLLPVLTNHHGVVTLDHDQVAPLGMVVACLSVLVGLGLAVLSALLFPSLNRSLARGTTYIGALLVCILVMPSRAPNRNHLLARQWAACMLESCPQGALLVSGHPGLTSMALALQADEGLRTDLQVLPAQALVHSSSRRRLRVATGDRAFINPVFPPQDAAPRWHHEQPMLASTYHKALLSGRYRGLDTNPALLDLALWDLLRDNARRHPLCFAGLPQDWLVARLQVRGSVLSFPSLCTSPARSLLNGLLDSPPAFSRLGQDPDASAPVQAFLLAFSAHARKHGQDQSARAYAQTAALLSNHRASAEFELARIAARAGQSDQAQDHATTALLLGLTNTACPSQPGAAAGILERDLHLAAALKMFHRSLRAFYPSVGDLTQSSAILWQEHEFHELAAGYEIILQQYPNDAEILYQWAASLVQLGQFQRARETLDRARALAHDDVEDALHHDGRFVLLGEGADSGMPA